MHGKAVRLKHRTAERYPDSEQRPVSAWELLSGTLLVLRSPAHVLALQLHQRMQTLPIDELTGYLRLDHLLDLDRHAPLLFRRGRLTWDDAVADQHSLAVGVHRPGQPRAGVKEDAVGGLRPEAREFEQLLARHP